MTMRRYPFEEMERMMEQMRRTMVEGTMSSSTVFGGQRGDINLGLTPSDDGYVAHADMPGFEKDEIDLRFDDGILSIEATHETSEDDDMSSRRHTRRVREQIGISGDVIEEEITASYRNGVLEVRLPVYAEDEDEDEDEGSRIDID